MYHNSQGMFVVSISTSFGLTAEAIVKCQWWSWQWDIALAWPPQDHVV